MEENLTQNKQRFLSLCGDIHRNGIQELLTWLEGSDFFTAPASRAGHGSYTGGLLAHSLHVYDHLTRILKAYPEIPCSQESAAICALFHDLCKVNFYTTERRNRKDANGRWESYDAYKIDEQFRFGGHGSKSMYLVQRFLPLTPEEATAINCHMGAFDNEHVGGSYVQFPLAWALHAADEAATFLTEGEV